MKKILLIILICLPLLLGQTIVRQSSVDIVWDTIVPIIGSTITYEVLRAPLSDKASLEIVGETALITYSVTFSSEGDWVIGVRTIRTIDFNGERLLSDINWSDVDGLATPNPFFVRWYVAPDAPENLRLQ